MDSKTIRTALGKLQVDPDSQDAWIALKEAALSPERELSLGDLLHLMNAAREKHRERGEWDAVAALLEIETQVAAGSTEEPDLYRQLARVLSDELFDDTSAADAYRKFLELQPSDEAAAAALEESEGKRQKYHELVETYLGEAEDAPDDVYRSSMLMRAAEMELRYAGQNAQREAIIDRLEQAVRLDPSNERAGRMLERLYRADERWDEVARVLERLADRAETPQGRIGAGVRLARLYRHKLDDQERAARAYHVILREVPDHREAIEFLNDFYSNTERWDELVGLYERQLDKADLNSPDVLGDVLQVAMLHWRKRARPQDAEPWFDKIRRVEPAHPLMLNFYREYAKEFDDQARLVDALQGAQRALSDGAEKATVGAELARLAEGQANAHKAIEQYKGVLRHDPDNSEAREALKRLYKQTQGYNALVELLRQQLERTPHEAYEERLGILREVATVYRLYIKSDTALVSVLNQIVQLDDKLDEHDVEEVRELVGLYEKLSRWRDLLTHQLKLAQITPDREEKKELYRAAARRWLEQFSNVQNATESYEALLELEPEDREARERLEELYKKRRAWPALYGLYQKELASADGPQRLTLLRDMAQLAAERLNRPADAMALYKSILEADPSRREVLDALEKFAERAKDWGTLAEALERRVDLAEDEQSKLATLQKLGAVYADHLQNPQQAASAWRRVLEFQPGHPRALRVLREAYLAGGEYDALEEMYGAQNDWEGLAEVFSTAADRAKDNAQKIALSYRAAAVYEDRLNQPDRAFRSYERVLSTDPTDARAARALVPLYEKDEKWARLPPLYELLQQASEDEDERLELLRKLTSVTGQRLGDRKAAVEFARKAYELSPANDSALELFRQAAREANAWEPFVQALEARLAAATPITTTPKKGKRGKKKEAEALAGISPDEQRMLELELAHVYVEQLGRIDEGIGAYKRLLAHEPGDRDATAALETILRREDRRDDLRWLLELRVEHADGDAERIEILAEWATLEEEVFDSKERAVRIYRRMLELDPSSEAALRALPRLLLEADDAAGAAEVLERHRDQLDGPERAAREADLAELYLSRLARPADALEAAIRALDEPDQAARAMRVLEKLLDEPSVAGRAAEVLASQYASGGDARREVQALSVMLRQATDPSEKMALYSRLADVHEEKLNAFSSALDVILRALGDFPRELGLWDRADSLAVLAGRPTDLADKLRDVLHAGELPVDIEIELCERAAKLHEDRLGDPIGATPYLERVLDLEPGNERAFRRLKDILTAAERWTELEGLYDKASRATDDPARQTDMLVEVALICEEIIEDVGKATAYYERILAVEPAHETATRALDRLYGVQERHQDLAGLLERRLETALADDAFELKLRIARLQLEKLHHPENAIDHVEDVLRERINDYNARELAEKLLAIGSLRARAARMLETVYEARDEIRDLVRVLEIRLEALEAAGEQVDSDERRELLRRIATLRDERMRDDGGALEVLSKLVPADPLDVDARERLLEIGRRMGAHERVAEVLSRAADRSDTPSMQGEILMQVARIYEDLLGDMERAEATYRRVLALDESDADLVLPPARALERIYIGQGAHDKLAEMLRVQVRLEQDGEVRRQLLGRLGEICQSVLGDNAGAIEAWRARAEDNPSDEAALAALDRLYEQTERWQDLVDVIERRKEVIEEPGARRVLMTRAAETLAGRLGKTAEAIDAWVNVVEEFGPDVPSLEALESLYRQAERWEELAETYDRHLEIVAADDKRLELLAKLGDTRRQHLNDVEGALDVYRRALSLDTTHAPSRAALELLLEAEETLTRREAAAILHPIYETDGDNERLLRVLEIEVEAAEDPDAKLEGLRAAMRVAEGPLQDSRRAFGYAERAVRAAVGHSDPTPWLEDLERLSQATGRQAEYVKLLSEVVPDIFDGDVQLAVTLKIADTARHQLADRELARTYYQKALELRADEKRALSALESLYEEAGDPQSLLEVLERRVEGAETDAERKQLLFRRARLLGDVVGDKRRAVEVYEAILDIDLDPAAVSALEGLYPEVGQFSELAGLYERQLDNAAGDAADLHVKIARVAARELGDVARAFEELDRALESNRQHAEAIAELERLLKEAPEPEHRGRAASLLEPVYLVRADYGKVMDCIRARLDASTSPDERRDLLGRLAQLYEEQQENYDAALETTAKLFHDDLSNQATLAELERLAKVAGAERRLAEILASELEQVASDDDVTANLASRTGELFDHLGDLDKALSFYRRALTFEPENRRLFAAIDGILRRTELPEQRIQLYRETLDHRFEPAERLEALHTIAALQRDELGSVDEAIETYRAALDVDETDRKSLDSLTDLYRQRERWDELSELYLRRAESSAAPEEAAKHRLELARLFKVEMRSTERALDQLEEIVRSVPSHTEAISELEALREQDVHKERVVEILRPIYESTDDWRHLIKLNEDRFELASDPGEKVSVLRETARLWEERGHDKGRARRALAVAFKIDPDDADVRSEYERLVEQTRAWDQLTETYEEALVERSDVVSKRDILSVLARVHDEKRDDPRRALQAYERLRAVDEADLEPLNKMETLSMLLSDWPTLVRVQTAKADLLLDDTERASVWRRVGEAKRDMLEDQSGAIEAYEHALELEPESASTIDRLIDLYEQRGEAQRLSELYEQRVEIAAPEEEDLKYDLLRRAAVAYEEKLGDRQRAIETLGRALGVRPADPGLLAALNRLYRAEQMWPELLDNLRLQASAAEDTAARADLRKQIGGILADKLESYEEALEAYRLVLDEAPGDTDTIAAVRKLGQDHDDLRLQVADVLVPVLRQTERFEDLVGVLEMRLSAQTDPSDRAETLRTIAETYEGRLGRPGDALGALLRALNERPDAVDLHADIERLARFADGFGKYVDALSERASSTFEPEISKDLYTRIGRIAEQELKDDRRAVEAYQKALEQAGDQPELLEALDRLYGRLGDAQALHDVLERRVELESDEARQAELYYRMAVVQIRDFSEAGRGLGSLRMALERAPEHEDAIVELEKLTDQRDLFEEAAEVLEGVYRARGRTDRLATLYEKRVGFADSPGERIEMRRSLARVLEEEGGDAASAQRVLQQGLVDDPNDPALLSEIERLAAITKNWEGAAAALRAAIDSRAELLPEQAAQLCRRVAGWQRDKMEDSAAAEQSLLKALEHEPNSDELLEELEALQRSPGREKDLVATLRRRAKLQLGDDAREELYRRAKDLAHAQNDAELAESVLRELLAHDDVNLWALRELTTLREAAGDYKETFELLVKRSELRAQGDVVRDLRKSAAQIARDKLQDRERAIGLYEQLFEDDPNDQESATALRELYHAAERWPDLARLLDRLVDLAESPSARSNLRLELARLNQEQFKAPDAAIQLLGTVLEEEPGRSEAVVALSELYEQTGRDEELAELLSTQIQAARDRGDTQAELTFLVRLAEVYESRLGDRQKAVETYRNVLDRDPQHHDALESLARLHETEGDFAEAARTTERLLELAAGDAKIALSSKLADLYGKLGDSDSASRALERGLEADERNPELRTRLQKLYESMSAWERLANHLAKDADFAESVDDKVKLLGMAAAIHSQKRSDHGAAAELLDKASQLKPDDRDLLLQLCDEYSASGRGKAAAEVLEKIVESYGGKRTKELGEIHRRLANAYLADGETQRALDELDKAFRIEPGNVQVLKRLGEVAIQLGDMKKAQQMFRALLLQKLDENSPITKAEVFLRLGEVHEKIDEKPKAIQMYERAVQADDKLEEAKQRLAALKG